MIKLIITTIGVTGFLLMIGSICLAAGGSIILIGIGVGIGLIGTPIIGFIAKWDEWLDWCPAWNSIDAEFGYWNGGHPFIRWRDRENVKMRDKISAFIAWLD